MSIKVYEEERVSIPAEYEVWKEGPFLFIKGPKGVAKRKIWSRDAMVEVEGKEVVIKILRKGKKGRRIKNTIKAHIRNMLRSTKEGFYCKLRICYSHFPMNVKVEGKKIVIENFLGERKPRVAEIFGDAKVEVKGKDVIVSGSDIEDVMQTALRIEQACRIRAKDRRVFQDGIWIVEKGYGSP